MSSERGRGCLTYCRPSSWAAVDFGPIAGGRLQAKVLLKSRARAAVAEELRKVETELSTVLGREEDLAEERKMTGSEVGGRARHTRCCAGEVATAGPPS